MNSYNFNVFQPEFIQRHSSTVICRKFKISQLTCTRYGSHSETCSIYYMFYASSSTADGRLSQECSEDYLPHFTRRLLDHRTAELVSQMRQTDEVYPRKHRVRRSDNSHGFSTAADALEAIDPASSAFGHVHGDKLGDEDGSGEPTYEGIPPADEISEGVVDKQYSGMLPSHAESGSADAVSQQRRAQMMPYASVVFLQQSTTLRMFTITLLL